jgi:hypothetical protein
MDGDTSLENQFLKKKNLESVAFFLLDLGWQQKFFIQKNLPSNVPP